MGQNGFLKYLIPKEIKAVLKFIKRCENPECNLIMVQFLKSGRRLNPWACRHCGWKPSEKETGYAVYARMD